MKGKFSYKWLQSYFDEELPPVEMLIESIQKYSFEVESCEKLKNDWLIEIEILPNRSADCLGHYGMAKEIGAIYGMDVLDSPYKDENKLQFKMNKNEETSIKVNTKYCERYTIFKMENCENLETPIWMRERLEAIGQKLINPIVDISNYILFDVGQPTHIFDADKVSGSFGVREAIDKESFVTLMNEEIELKKGDLVIVDEKNQEILGLAGIKGAKIAEVTKETKNIYVETATFDQVKIRNTSRRTSLNTDASTRFSQGFPIELIDYTSYRTERLLSEIVGGFSKDFVQHLSINISQSVLEKIKEIRGDKAEKVLNIIKQKIPNRRYLGFSIDELTDFLGLSLVEKSKSPVPEIWIEKKGIGESDIIRILRTKFNFKYSIVENPRDLIAKSAEDVIGAKYVRGASVIRNAPEYFDCSSLVTYCATRAGVSFARIAINQFLSGYKINEKNAERGDLVFFKRDSDTKLHKNHIFEETVPVTPGKSIKGVNHVGILVSKDEIIHAEGDTGVNKVVKEKLKDVKGEIVGYRRILQNNSPRFVIEVPVERVDLKINVDLIEEIARMYGYDKLATKEITEEKSNKGKLNKEMYYRFNILKALNEIGFSEVITYTFRSKGEVKVAYPVAKDKDNLRKNLTDGLKEAIELNSYNGELLGLEEIRILEFGKVFTKSGEKNKIAFGVSNILGRKKIDEDKIAKELMTKLKSIGIDINIKFNNGIFEADFDEILKTLPEVEENNFLKKVEEIKYKIPFKYPFVLRDISIFVPKETGEKDIEKVILENSGEFYIRHSLIDIFKKEDKISYTFRIIFQSDKRTLNDLEINSIMDKLTKKIQKNNLWEVR